MCELLSAMRRQTLFAVEESDVVLMIVDGRVGLMPQDQEILNELSENFTTAEHAFDQLLVDLVSAETFGFRVQEEVE